MPFGSVICSCSSRRWGDVLSEQRQHLEALAHYQAALQLDLTSVGAVIKLGSCLAELNRHGYTGLRRVRQQ